MNIKKINGTIIDADLCQYETLNNNKKILVQNFFNYNLPIEQKQNHIEKCKLIFNINIKDILNFTNIKNIQVLINQKGKSQTTLLFLDKNGNILKNNIQIICNKCGKIFHTQRGHLLRRKHLLCKNCCYSFAQLNGGMEKYEQTMLKKYGCRRPIQNKQIKEKTKQTMMKKYGACSPLQSEIIKQKIAKTMMKKYGVINPWKSNIFQNKCKQKYINHSKKSDDLMERLSHDIPFKLFYGDNEKLFTFKNHWYRVDGFIEEKNFAIEFQGDYYHANPELYNKDYVFNIWGKKFTAKEIWEKDSIRKKELEQKYHIKVFYIWEKELDEYGYEFILNKIKKELKI